MCAQPTKTANRIKETANRDERWRWLHELIRAEHPEIDDPGISDWSLSNLLRQFAFRHIRRANDATLMLDQDPEFRIYQRDAPDLFQAFEANRAGVLGGGMCHTQRELYIGYGLESWIIDCGFADKQMTRVSVVVRIEHGAGQACWVVQDPNYDFVVTRTDGGPLDYFDFLSALARRTIDDFAIAAGDPEAWRYIIMDPQNIQRMAAEWTLRPVYPDCRPELVLENGMHVYKAYMSWARYDALAESARTPLVEAGLPANLLYYYLLPVAVYPFGHPGAVAFEQRVRQHLAALGVTP
jgi:hypothetical protein